MAVRAKPLKIDTGVRRCGGSCSMAASPRHAKIPVNFGVAGPNSVWRTRE